MSDNVIRQFVRVQLAEDAMWNIHIKPKRLYDTFVNPFLDVFRVAQAETEKLSASLQRLVKTISQAILATAIPMLKGNYKKIKDQERAQLARINSKYADVYKRIQAGIDFPDFQLALFSSNPAAYIAARIVSLSGDSAVDMLGTLAGELHPNKVINLGTGHTRNATKWSPYQDDFVFFEAATPKISKEKIESTLNQSQFFKSLVKNSIAARKGSVGIFVDIAKNISSAKTVADLSAIIGKDFSSDVSDPNSNDAIVDIVKPALLGRIIDMLRNDPDVIRGGPELRAVYDDAIKQIEAMRK